MLALLLGGGDAVRGLPALVGVFLPGGITAAHADVQGPSGQVNLPLYLPRGEAAFAPQVLTPVAARGFPDWLVTRARFAGLASGGAAAVPARAPAIAIVIDDLGPDVAATRRAIALPKAITLSFLPYGEDTPALARAGKRAGHQVMVHVPMEPEGTEDPGPMALRTDLSASENLRRFDWALSRVPGHSGLNNHMGSRFTSDQAALIPVMAHLQGRGLFFLDFAHDPEDACRAAGAHVRCRKCRARCLSRRCAEPRRGRCAIGRDGARRAPDRRRHRHWPSP